MSYRKRNKARVFAIRSFKLSLVSDEEISQLAKNMPKYHFGRKVCHDVHYSCNRALRISLLSKINAKFLKIRNDRDVLYKACHVDY